MSWVILNLWRKWKNFSKTNKNTNDPSQCFCSSIAETKPRKLTSVMNQAFPNYKDISAHKFSSAPSAPSASSASSAHSVSFQVTTSIKWTCIQNSFLIKKRTVVTVDYCHRKKVKKCIFITVNHLYKYPPSEASHMYRFLCWTLPQLKKKVKNTLKWFLSPEAVDTVCSERLQEAPSRPLKQVNIRCDQEAFSLPCFYSGFSQNYKD